MPAVKHFHAFNGINAALVYWLIRWTPIVDVEQDDGPPIEPSILGSQHEILEDVQILNSLFNAHHLLGSGTLAAKQHLEAFAGGLLGINVYNAAWKPFAVQSFQLFLSQEDDGLGSGLQAFVTAFDAHARERIGKAVRS